MRIPSSHSSLVNKTHVSEQDGSYNQITDLGCDGLGWLSGFVRDKINKK